MTDVRLFDEIRCQVLKVSGPNKLEKAIDVTQTVKAMASYGVYNFSMTKEGGATEGLVNVTISPLDTAGNVITGVTALDVWISDVATGIGVAATWVPDTITAAEGAVIAAHTAAKVLQCVTNALGVLELVITDAEYATLGAGYVAVANPSTGRVQTLAIEVADYTPGE